MFLTSRNKKCSGQANQVLNNIPLVHLNEVVQGPCAHLQLYETLTVVLDRLNANTDRLNVISSVQALSGSVV
jgi:hypothetical protein